MSSNLVVILIFGIYMLVMVLIGEICARYKIKSLKDYLLAGGRQGILITSGSLSATVLGAGSTIGASGVAYYVGISAGWYIVSAVIALNILAFTFAPAIKALSLYTVPEYMETRYGKSSRLLTAILGLAGLTLFLSAQFYALGIAGQYLLNWPLKLSILILGLALTLYTWRGGNWGVQLTDNLQYILILAGIVFFTLFLLNSISFSDFQSPPPAKGFEELGKTWFNPTTRKITKGWDIFALGNTILAWIIMSTSWHFSMQSTAQRILSSRDPKTAKISCIFSSFFLLPISFGIGIIGMGSRILFPDLPPTGDISQSGALSLLIREHLPPVLSGLMVSALVAVIMSTCDSALLGASTLIVKDIFHRFIKPEAEEKELIRLSKNSTLLIGFLGVVGGLTFLKLIQLLETVAAIYCVSLFVPILLGLYWKKPKEPGAIAAMGASFLTGLIWRLSGLEKATGIHMLNLCLSLSLVAIILATFIKRNTKRMDKFPGRQGHPGSIKSNLGSG